MKSKRVKILAFNCHIDYCDNIREELSANGIDCDIKKVDDFQLDCNTLQSRLKKLREALRKENEEVNVFIPNSTELYLEEPDFSLMFSGYRSWCDPSRIKIIPHIWTPTPGLEVSDLKEIKWSKKPDLSVGFMGNSFEASKAAMLTTYLPVFLKKQILEGKYLRNVALYSRARVPFRFLPCFVRIEAIRKLEATSLKQDIVKRNFFKGSSEEVRDFKNHLIRNTYILCPRGSENYSYRFYEALSFGRVPVLIDTNMLLPSNVNWDKICLRIPYENISDLEKTIRDDYETRTESDFNERQEEALKIMEELRKWSWLKGIIAQIALAAQ